MTVDKGDAGSPLAIRSDWSRLVGQSVEVWRGDRHVARGVVDQATSDDSVVWLVPAGVENRRLFDKLAGYELRASPTPHEETGSARVASKGEPGTRMSPAAVPSGSPGEKSA